MTATDELRRLLDERGVEYRFNDATKVFEWHFDGTDGEGSAHATEVDGGINIIACSITPEQAIAATLGPAARHPKPHEQWTTVLLSEIAWDWGDRWPDYLSVAHDAYGEWRVYVPEDTLGSSNCTNSERTETCHADETETWQGVCMSRPIRYVRNSTIHVMECDACGRTYEHVNGDYELCPRCGRKRVGE